jgi:hypothetical protein
MATNPLIEMFAKLTPEEKGSLLLMLGGSPSVAPKKKFVQGGEFWTTQSRYIDGRYVTATPDYPAKVKFPAKFKIAVNDDGTPEDSTLIPVAKGAPVQPPKENLIKPFAEIRRGPPGKKVEDGETRPSDEDPGAEPK